MSVRLRAGLRRAAHGDDGTGTVWVVVASALVLAMATWSVVAAVAADTRQRAEAAADLAALAGATHVDAGTTAACAVARSVAAANHAGLGRCEVDGATGVVEVVVEVQGRGPLASVAPARARARAGPSSTVATRVVP